MTNPQNLENRAARLVLQKKEADFLGGFRCDMCEYDLCTNCSVVYCRYGHKLKIWTLPEAISTECDLCKKSGITSGYRCLECNVDVCDLCTARDGRNAFMQYPLRDIDRIVESLESIREQSQIADDYLKRQEGDFQALRKTFSMSRLAASHSNNFNNVGSEAKSDVEELDVQLAVPHSFLLLKAQQLQTVLKSAETDLQARKARIKAKKYGQKQVDL
mmetsp:Transcript_23351/g.31964  ORF Transcript_23351/g.31964 Transcript_23351/m.31964 type:complete len:217 (+) Transcript_23351:1998-2648(+)